MILEADKSLLSRSKLPLSIRTPTRTMIHGLATNGAMMCDAIMPHYATTPPEIHSLFG